MSKIRRSSPLVPTASSYVRSVLGKIGLAAGAAFSGRPGTSTPFWTHSLADWALGLLTWKGLMVSYTHGMHKDIRKRALKKKEREAKQQ
jgi:17beta-estradiol 17-dehydrogenase / very-long-chain 3-oxoacyl-CoA reductase